MILAIDPGNIQSAYVVLDDNLKPVRFDKVDNEELLREIYWENFGECRQVALEMIAHYGTGMPAGKEVFDTCVFIGQLKEAFANVNNPDITLIYRKDEKMDLCHTMKAKDTNIRQALIDRFAKFDFKNGKGTKSNQDFFYGFKADIWQAMAIGVTFYDLYINKK